MPKALLLTELGKLELKTVDTQVPGAGQVLVEVMAVAQNPLEMVQHDRGLLVPSYPYILGVDVAGIVSEVGPDVTSFKKGDRIVAITKAGHQTHVIVNVILVSKIPENITFEQACTIPLALCTASVGFYGALEFPETNNGDEFKGQYFLVWSAASSVGALAVQLARLLGFTVIATASPHNFEYVKSLGASVVFDYKDPEVANKIRQASNNSLQYAYDACSKNGSTETIVKALRDEGGSIIDVFPMQNKVVPSNVRVYPTMAADSYNPEKAVHPICKRLWGRLEGYLRDGRIKPNAVKLMPKGLLGVTDGIAYMRSGKVSGVKLVYRIKDTEQEGEN